MDDVNGNLLTVFLPLAIISIVFGLPIFAFVFSRVLAHRERMAMIAAGLAPGTATLGTANSKIDRAYATEPASVVRNKGIRLAAIGTAITIGISIATFHTSENGITWHPGPWLLLGLVPMFIGIAQVIIGVLSSANVVAAAAPSPAPAAPAPAPAPASASAPFAAHPTVKSYYPVVEFHPPAPPEP